jgi:hypothetical protein
VGKRIPSEIKNKVLDSWLFGIPSNMIATCNGIGYGSVYRIIESFKSKIPDLDVLRAVAVMIRQEGLSLNDVASSIRIKIFFRTNGIFRDRDGKNTHGYRYSFLQNKPNFFEFC